MLSRLRRFIGERDDGSHEERKPAPFIVGAPRSGTTLLRLMLDAHPDLAIPAETGFFITLAGAADAGAYPRGGEELWRLLTQSSTWPDLATDPEEFQDALKAVTVPPVADGLRTFYRLYATNHGKNRWGDKSPLHCYHLPRITQTLPEAHIIHIIRDGRDVAASLRDVWFAPAKDAPALAAYWSQAVQAGRQGGARCPHYMELRYEDLLQRPEGTLRRVCDFIELPFDAAMLAYYQQAADRLQEVQDRPRADGEGVISREQRLRQQQLTSSPPAIERIGRWSDAWTSAEVAEFQAVAGLLLADLGYTST